ncbi:alpha/beta hydrolase [Candidatus Frankia alpina]|uniref:alpha/beta hydrolase n=1 Tax=Candidatus Frankia alpina TaxID=2699483 RepID=UPI003AF4F48F
MHPSWTTGTRPRPAMPSPTHAPGTGLARNAAGPPTSARRPPLARTCPPYAAPARAASLAGLPPTFLISGDLELARDEVLDFASRLAQADVPVELHLYPGATHGFDVVVPEAAVSRASRRAQTEALVRALHPARSAPPR